LAHLLKGRDRREEVGGKLKQFCDAAVVERNALFAVDEEQPLVHVVQGLLQESSLVGGKLFVVLASVMSIVTPDRIARPPSSQ
jgi:hypothetical protein